MAVHLVGAGPGDPELLTLRAARLLAEADVVLHDRLAGPAVLALCRPDTLLVDVGKRAGESATQEAINDLLVAHGRSAGCVVRLKGGDPFVFGRGGEEAQACLDAGIEVHVVPGVSSALAAPARAGIPLTHRGTAGGFTVVTGHRRVGEAPVDWTALARLGHTLVVLMGVERRAEMAAELLAAGLASDTPVAAVGDASTPQETVLRCRLDELAALPVRAPAVIVIGAVAALDVRSWTAGFLRDGVDGAVGLPPRQ